MHSHQCRNAVGVAPDVVDQHGLIAPHQRQLAEQVLLAPLDGPPDCDRVAELAPRAAAHLDQGGDAKRRHGRAIGVMRPDPSEDVQVFRAMRRAP